MFRSFIISSVRSLLKDRLNSVINLFGLSVGLACSVLIYLYVKNELTYDRFHLNYEHIYRVYTTNESKSDDHNNFNTTTSALLGPTMKASLPEVSRQVRMTQSACKVTLKDKKIKEEIGLFDSAFFEIFSFKPLKGSLHQALDDPNNLVLSEKTAKKYFGDSNPVGEQLQVKIADESNWYTIKAVIENPPPNSSITYSLIAPYENAFEFIPADLGKTWDASFGETYVLLHAGTDPGQASEKMAPVMKAALGDKYVEGDYEVHLQPMKELHFSKGGRSSGLVRTADIKYVYIISGVALLILLLASINFTTLSIGKSFSRAKEVGVRKVVGASRSQIIRQFLGESILMTFIGFLIALLTASYALPWFNDLSGVALEMEIEWTDLLAFVLFGILVGVLSGCYPALLISKFQSYRIIKGDFGSKLKKHNLRKGLVIVQYVIAIAFISITLLMLRQMKFLMNRDLGFEREQLIDVIFESDISKGLQYSAESSIAKGAKIRSEFERITGVSGVGFSTNKFDGNSWIRVGSAEKGEEEDMIMLSATFVDEHYIPTLEIELIAGRNFSGSVPADAKTAVIINEALAKKMAWEDPLKEQLPGRYEPHEIIGVVKNFNYETMHREIRPLYLTMNPELMFEAINSLNMTSLPSPNMYVKVEGGDVKNTLSRLEKVAHRLYPDESVEIEFVDESIQAQYEKERNLNKIITAATILAIVVSSLGLFGLSFLTLNARTKEIGIRKALGASFGGLLIHLFKDYLIIISISIIVALPIAYLFIQKWLQEFEFRITVMPRHFMLAIIISLSLSILTISYLAIKSAVQNPANSLRYE
ncbi:MAG: ABC transporter permease [Cytophagales bacterium]|nr:ABC transporter permease [Cytophagales bacterium]